MALSAFQQLQTETPAVTDMREEWHAADEWSGAIALDGRSGQAYNEDAFRYFLEIERKRADTSSRPLLLLLVDFQSEPGAGAGMGREVVARVFTGLTACLRDTDFIGWYHETRVVGAVLTQRAETPAGEASQLVNQRVSRRLRELLPARVAGRLQVRVFQISTRADA